MSKASVHLLGDCMRHEMAGVGVSVTIIVPGFVESEIRKVNNRGVYRPEARESIPKWLPMPAATAARKIVGAIERRRRMVVLTGHGRLAVSLQRHVPGLLHAVIGRLGGRPARDTS